MRFLACFNVLILLISTSNIAPACSGAPNLLTQELAHCVIHDTDKFNEWLDQRYKRYKRDIQANSNSGDLVEADLSKKFFEELLERVKKARIDLVRAQKLPRIDICVSRHGYKNDDMSYSLQIGSSDYCLDMATPWGVNQGILALFFHELIHIARGHARARYMVALFLGLHSTAFKEIARQQEKEADFGAFLILGKNWLIQWLMEQSLRSLISSKGNIAMLKEADEHPSYIERICYHMQWKVDLLKAQGVPPMQAVQSVEKDFLSIAPTNKSRSPLLKMLQDECLREFRNQYQANNGIFYFLRRQFTLPKLLFVATCATIATAGMLLWKSSLFPQKAAFQPPL